MWLDGSPYWDGIQLDEAALPILLADLARREGALEPAAITRFWPMVRKAAGFTDFFLICSGGNTRQIRAIADGIIEALAAAGVKPAHVEGYDRSEWILLDYFDFIVHIFATERRLFYGLERLWGNADRIEVNAN